MYKRQKKFSLYKTRQLFGPFCRVNGPVAALVAETDLTLLMFGGGMVLVVFVVILGAIFVCRRSSSAGSSNSQLLKYSLHPLPLNGKDTTNNGMSNNGVHSVHRCRDR